MRNKVLFGVMVVIVFFLLSFIGRIEVQAGSKDMISSKRTRFKDDNVASMRDVFAQKEAEEDEYRQKMLSNSDQTIELLTQIRDLLESLNEEK